MMFTLYKLKLEVYEVSNYASSSNLR